MDKILEYLDKHYYENDLVKELIEETDVKKTRELRAKIFAVRRIAGEIKVMLDAKK